jgi:hypothetical protein
MDYSMELWIENTKVRVAKCNDSYKQLALEEETIEKVERWRVKKN